MSPLARNELRHITELRARLEAYAAGQAALRADRARRPAATMQKTLRAMERAVGSRDYAAFQRADARLHEAIIEMSGIPVLREAWLPLWQALRPFHHDSLEACWPDWRLLIAEHRNLVEAIRLGDPAAAELAVHDHLEAVWHRYDELRGTRKEDDPVARAKAFVAFRLSSPIRLEEVARRVAFTSPGNLSRLFRRRHGVGFQKYVQDLRMAKAASLLTATRLPVAAVARRVGYRDVSRFGQHFKRHHRKTPTAFRANPVTTSPLS